MLSVPLLTNVPLAALSEALFAKLKVPLLAMTLLLARLMVPLSVKLPLLVIVPDVFRL